MKISNTIVQQIYKNVFRVKENGCGWYFYSYNKICSRIFFIWGQNGKVSLHQYHVYKLFFLNILKINLLEQCFVEAFRKDLWSRWPKTKHACFYTADKAGFCTKTSEKKRLQHPCDAFKLDYMKVMHNCCLLRGKYNCSLSFLTEDVKGISLLFGALGKHSVIAQNLDLWVFGF